MRTFASPAPPDHTRIEDAERRALRAQARAMPEEAAFICETLRLARLCPRAICRKADRCRGDKRMCLDSRGEAAPDEVFAFAVELARARQDGEPAEEVEISYELEALAHRCWVAALEARVRRDEG